VLILVTQWCWAPVDALAVLQKQDMKAQSDLSLKERIFEDLTWIHIKVKDVLGQKDCISPAPWGTPGCEFVR
jgi:hypothetical protein